MTTWRVTHGPNQSIEPNLFDSEVVDTANPFGSYAVAYIDDQDNQRFQEYERGTRVEFYASDTQGILTVNSGDTYSVPSGTTDTYAEADIDGTLDVDGTLSLEGFGSPRFTGFVVERRTTEEQGSDTLEVECYTFDQFLRRGAVSSDTSGETISQALEDIITRDTPADWNAANVEVGEDVELTRNYQGEKVENALQSLRNKSVNEEFGVNEDIEFYWRPSESSNAPRDLGDSDIFNYDIPERGKRTVNEVTVFYDGGDKSVTVDNGSDKKQLQSNIGTSGPVTLSEEIHRDSITNLSDAQDAGERYLAEREPLLTGTITTFGLYSARPGDVIGVQYTPRDLDTEFRIAELEYLWGRAETRLTIVEKRGQQDDLLINLSDSVKRLADRSTNRDGESNRVTSTDVGVLLESSLDVDGVSETSSRVVNTGRNKLRDAWAGESPIDVAELAVGDDPASPKRSQSSLGNELERVSVTETLPDAFTAEYSADFTTTDIREVGLFDTNGDMIARATIPDTSLSSPVSVTYTFTTDNDPQRGGVVTDAGQTAVRDSLADNSPSTPTEYGYGDDGTDPTTGDTALGNQLVRVPINELLVQSASTQSGFQSITSFADTLPVTATGSDTLAVEQTAFTTEAENGTTSGTTSFFATRYSGNGVDAGDGEAVQFTGSGQSVKITFTPGYDIPASDFALYVRVESNNSPAIDASVNGETWEALNDGATIGSVGWRDVAAANTGGVSGGYQGGDFTAGTTYTVRFESTSSGGSSARFDLDVIAPLDSRYSYTFDNTTSAGSNGGTYLDGPEFFPAGVLAGFQQETTTRLFDGARVDTTWNNTTGNQFIELSNDGGSTWQQLANTEDGSVSFSSSNTQVQARVNLSRYGSRSTATPQEGFNGQSVSDWNLFADIFGISPEDNGLANVNAIVNVGDEGLVGEVFREAGEFASNGDLLSHAVFAEFSLLSTGPERVLSSEAFSWQNVE